MSLGRLVRGQARGLPADRDRGKCESLCVRGLLRLPANLDSQLRGSAFTRISSTPTRDDSNIPPHTTPPRPPHRALPAAHTARLPSYSPDLSPTSALLPAREKKPVAARNHAASQPASSTCKLGPTIALACPRARSLLPPASCADRHFPRPVPQHRSTVSRLPCSSLEARTPQRHCHLAALASCPPSSCSYPGASRRTALLSSRPSSMGSASR